MNDNHKTHEKKKENTFRLFAQGLYQKEVFGVLIQTKNGAFR